MWDRFVEWLNNYIVWVLSIFSVIGATFVIYSFTKARKWMRAMQMQNRAMDDAYHRLQNMQTERDVARMDLMTNYLKRVKFNAADQHIYYKSALEAATEKQIASVESARDAEIERLKGELKNKDESQSREKKSFEQQMKKVEEDAKKKIQQIEADKEDFIKSLEIQDIQTKNLRGSTEYFEISKYHAKASFVISVIACFVGLALLAIAAVFAIKEQDFRVGIMPAIGGAVANFIAATVFWVHNKSAQQLNRYYDSLHEIEVFLSSVKVIEKISTKEKQDEAYAKILDELFNIQKIKAAKPAKHDKPNDKEG